MEKNAAKAVEWYRKAAEQGEVHAQYNLGGCYENSIGGLTQNNDEALKWYKKAADQGHEEAKKAIDRMQGGGLGSAVAAGAALAGVGLLWKILNS